MKRIGSSSAAIALFMLVACKAQPDTALDNSTSHNAAIKSTKTSSSGDQALGKELAGDWVISEVRPTGSAEDNCATDAGITLDADGGYGSLDETGAWAVKNRTLIISATSSIDDTDTNRDEAKEVPINPPRVRKWPIVKVEGNIAVMHSEGGQFWMFRCSPPPKG